MKTIALLLAGLLFCGTALADHHMQAQPTVYGQSYNIIVSDPAAVVAAMKKFRESPTGRQQPSSVVLSQNVANGEAEATHTVNVFYPSAEAMDANMRLTEGSADSAEFARAFQPAATLESDILFSLLISRINQDDIDSPATMLFALNVTDQAAFMKALNTLLDSKAASSFPGNLFFGAVVAMGEAPSTHWVSFQSSSVGTLLTGVDAFMKSADFAAYAKNAPSFREVTSRTVSRQILELAPATQ